MSDSDETRRQDRPSGTDFVLADFLPFKIVYLGQAMGEALSRHYTEEFDLSVAEWRTLSLIGQYEAITAVEVVRQTPMDKVAVSRASARLVKQGLVERIQRPEDRRSVLMRLTEKGKDVFETIAQRVLGAESRMLEPLSDDEQKILATAFDKLSEQIKRESDL